MPKYHETTGTQWRIPTWPFNTAAIILIVLAFTIWFKVDLSSYPEWTIIGAVCLLAIAAALFLVWPTIVRARLQALLGLPEMMREINGRILDADSALKAYGRTRMAIEALHESVVEEQQALEANLDEFKRTVMNFKQKDEELQRTRQEAGETSREIDAWVQCGIDYFDYLQRLREQPELEEIQLRLVERMADTYERFTSARQLDRICPTAGSPFIIELHHSVSEEESYDVFPGTVLRCTSWGYRVGDRIVKKARVILAKEPVAELEEDDTKYVEI